MNKGELIGAMAEASGLSKADSERALNGLMSAITQALNDGQPVSLVGFGNFSVRERPARTGRNPQTGRKIRIAASRAPVFKAGKALKDAVQ